MAKESKKTAGVKAPVVEEAVTEEILKAPKVEIKEPEVKKAKEPVEEVKSRNPKGCGKCPITYGHALCSSCVEYKD